MVNQRHCPYCAAPARVGCDHLGLAAPGREFVRLCIEAAQSQRAWAALCAKVHESPDHRGGWSPDREDFTWLETAFCERFLKPLRWFGGIDYEWRCGDHPGQGSFYVLLWSKAPRNLWWELQECIERQLVQCGSPSVSRARSGPELFALAGSRAPSKGRARL